MVVAPGDARLGSVGQYTQVRSGHPGSVSHQCQSEAATDQPVKVDTQNLYSALLVGKSSECLNNSLESNKRLRNHCFFSSDVTRTEVTKICR